MKYFVEPEKKISVAGDYDVVVIGGGPAGTSAAVAAARNSAKTAIIERFGYFGGQATGGLVILIVGLTDGKNKIIKGFCQELIDDLFKMNAAENVGNHVLFSPEPLKLLLDSKILESNVTPHLHTFVSDVIVENNSIKAIVTEGKSGRQCILGKVFIDATGDADLAKYAGIPYEIEDKNNLMPVTLCFRAGGVDVQKAKNYISENINEFNLLLEKLGLTTKVGGWIKTTNPGEAWINLAHIENIDPTSCIDLTTAEIFTRKKSHDLMREFKLKIPGFENAYIIDTAQQIGVRDSRRISGVYKFTESDVNKNFTDTIARAPNYTGNGLTSVEIPYRTLITSFYNNIIFCGRSISVQHKLINMFREIPCCIATGQAAGLAASLAVKNNALISNQNMNELQLLLKKQNAVLDLEYTHVC